MVESKCIGADLVGRPVVQHVGTRIGQKTDLQHSGQQKYEASLFHVNFQWVNSDG